MDAAEIVVKEVNCDLMRVVFHFLLYRRRRAANTAKGRKVMAMHFAIWIPDWGSLDSVRSAHSELELAAIIFFGLLALFDILAHFAEDNKEREKILERIGLFCFGLAIVAEISGYIYGQRNDFLSGQQISSLDAKANDASQKAAKALTDSSDAENKSVAAQTKAENAKELAGKAEGEAGEAQKKLKALSENVGILSDRVQDEVKVLKALTPRSSLLNDANDDLVSKLSPFNKQPLVVQFCGSLSPKGSDFTDAEKSEQRETWAVLFRILHGEAGWGNIRSQIVWENCKYLGAVAVGITVFASSEASPRTKEAAQVLHDELVGVLPTIGESGPVLCDSTTGSRPIDEQAPWRIVVSNPNVIAVLVGVQPEAYTVIWPARRSSTPRAKP